MAGAETTMTGKVCAITGPTHGIGRALAAALAARGARLILLCRDESAGNALASELARGDEVPVVVQVDLASLSSVARAADRVSFLAPRLDVLVNNAGVFNQKRRETGDGIEEMFAVNYLAHFSLTTRLLPRLSAAEQGRIVHTSSGAHAFVPRFDFEDFNWTRRRYRMFPAYAASKLATMLFNQALGARLSGSACTSNAFHPGWVGTQLGANNGLLGALALALVRPFARTPERGAETGLYLACDPGLAGRRGEYFQDRRAIRAASSAREAGAPERLWELSERLLGAH